MRGPAQPVIHPECPPTFMRCVADFCRKMEQTKIVKCPLCESDAYCEATQVNETFIEGTFVCEKCGYEFPKYARLNNLKKTYEELTNKCQNNQNNTEQKPN